MKIFTIAAVTLTLFTMSMMSVQAQARRPAGDEKKKTEQKPQVDEGAYKAALERIPEPKEKYDPWGVARPTDAKKSK
jgi:hypothetical protein